MLTCPLTCTKLKMFCDTTSKKLRKLIFYENHISSSLSPMIIDVSFFLPSIYPPADCCRANSSLFCYCSGRLPADPHRHIVPAFGETGWLGWVSLHCPELKHRDSCMMGICPQSLFPSFQKHKMGSY